MKLMLMVVAVVAVLALVAVPRLALAEDGNGSGLGLNWETGLLVVMMLITALAATAWVKAKAAIRDSQALLQALTDALADDKIDNEELTKIALAAKKAGQSWAEFGVALADLFRRSKVPVPTALR